VVEPGTHSGGGRRRLSREEARALTRARLLEAAAAVFAERGFYGASVEEIAERAGFSRGAFYSNFESKEDVFLALLDVHIDADLRSLQEALQRDASPEAFVEFLRSRGGRHTKETEAWRLLSAEFWLHVVRHPELAPKLAARQRAARSAIARVVESQSAEMGIALPMPAEDLASVLMAVDDGLALQEYLDPPAVATDLRLRSLVLLFQGLAAGQ
jgi:AcrR family transcriptional regulator